MEAVFWFKYAGESEKRLDSYELPPYVNNSEQRWGINKSTPEEECIKHIQHLNDMGGKERVFVSMFNKKDSDRKIT